MKTRGRLVTCVGTALWLAAGGCSEPKTADAFEEESTAIANGTDVGTNGYGVVAVYHRRTSSPSSDTSQKWYFDTDSRVAGAY